MAVEIGVIPEGVIEIVAGQRRRQFSNVVLDGGWEHLVARLGDEEAVPTWLHFGTGDTEPSASDTGLEQRDPTTSRQETPESRTYSGLSNASLFTSYSDVFVRFDYDAGDLTGTWTELGLSYDESASQPYNRALIRDENGVPTPLVVNSWESVVVFARLRLSLGGLGQTYDISEIQAGVSGVLMPDGNMGDSSQGMWKKGLPIAAARIGGNLTMAEQVDFANMEATHYFFVPASTAWSASSIVFYAQGDAPMMRLALSPPLSGNHDYTASFRLRVQLVDVRE